MKVLTAEFLRAAENKKDYPAGELAEIAFAGRSNVGKSSMINTLLGRRNLVRTSKTPGHTRKLNFYLINGQLIFVDLPGYGFAKVPLEIREKWGPMVESYIEGRKQLGGVVVIVDARRPPTESDLTLIHYLQAYDKPLIIAATKADKLNRREMAEQGGVIRAVVGEKVPVIIFSSQNGLGKNELWKEIKNLIE
ncbi:MAG: YihA family ribosome biogenesis GTP-binding protein [Desulfomonile tiedjei]|uniref:Probable GTP-binding protein EngB n=1 Tax=Desulfomonile tiedjei TaxID=2358 RepID=A0A9D6Z8K1_9BACT|nr:YihA family ribosome biogenesis GTP-binding protein [Desulfomonile tiedjei]